MKQYNGHLMLNENNVFGPVCYKSGDLTKAIKNTYLKEQGKDNVEKYRKIVEFHDNKNTERLIEYLQKDKILKKVK